MPITWRDAMSVGDARVDDDHKHLIKLINAFEAIAEAGAEPAKVEAVFKGLKAYTEEHFSREERLQLAARYPYYESHLKAHRGLIRQLEELRSEWQALAAGPGRDQALKDLAAFLRDWLVAHILKEDLRLKPYLAKLPATESAPS